MSLIYAAGVEATAIANITSAINARIETIVDGSKDLNRESLKAWLIDQFKAMLTDGEATSAGYVATLNIDALVAPLSDAIAALRARTDFPHVVTDATAIAAVSRMQGELRTLSADLTAFYKDTPRQVGDVVANYLNDNNIQAEIPAGVTREVRDRGYIVTFVTDRGEESGPSPVSALVAVDQNDTTTVQRPEPPAGRNIAYWRPYRSADGNQKADFELVPNPADVKGYPIATTSITDAFKDNQLGELCRSLTWHEPPADLVHVKAGANGINAGHTGNTWYCCVPYRPYAWLTESGRTTDYPIVNHAPVDQSWVVLTQGRPYLMSGADPLSISSRKLDCQQACIATRSVVEVKGGVIYASPDGLVVIDGGGNDTMLTGDLFDKPTWEALVPSSIVAAEHDGVYYFQFTGAGGGCYGLNLRSGRLQKHTLAGSAFYRDMLTDSLYLASGTAIKKLFGDAAKKSGQWKSRLAVLNTAGFKFVQAESTFDAPVTVKVWMNDPNDPHTGTQVLLDTIVLTDNRPQLLAEGAGERWEVEVQSAATSVSSVTLATSLEEFAS